MQTTRAALLRALVDAGAGMSLTEAARAVGLTPPATLRQLATLVAEGLVRREGHQKEARYRLEPCLHAVWTHAEPGGALAEEWTHRGPVDWRFPLVSRVPDAPARLGIVRLLEQCARQGLFTPWLLDHVDPAFDGHDATWAGLDPEERLRRLRDPRNHGDVHVYAYGSCVRGDAHAGSDVDLLLVHDLTRQGVPPFPYEARVRRVVDALNLGVPRRLDVRVHAEDDLFEGVVGLYERVRREILDTAITVFSTSASPRFIEIGRAQLGEDVGRWTSGRG